MYSSGHDDVPFICEFVRMCSNYRIINDIRVLFGCAFYANAIVMLRLCRPPVTNCAIVSPPSLLHAVLTVATTGEVLSLAVSIAA